MRSKSERAPGAQHGRRPAARTTALGLLVLGEMAVTSLDPAIAVGPALLAFFAAALVLIRRGSEEEPAGGRDAAIRVCTAREYSPSSFSDTDAHRIDDVREFSHVIRV